MICRLVLEDGCVFTGELFGAPGTRAGEVVFNTAMTGYQEIFTDPSYCGQIVVMTFPLMGNYGVNETDVESDAPRLAGFAVSDLPRQPSNFRAVSGLGEYLTRCGVTGIRGIDTRALTRRIRRGGAVRAVISSETASHVELINRARQAPTMTGANLVSEVTCRQNRSWTEPVPAMPSAGGAEPELGMRNETGGQRAVHLVAIDCGIKHNILRHLARRGDRVTVVPAAAEPETIRALGPDGVLVGNGPGDPEAVAQTIETLRELIGTVPLLGICLGHQMMALAAGAATYKLKFGHHGGNVPVLNKPAERVEITSQNHGFAVDAGALDRVGAVITHVNLNDGSVEGFVLPDRQAAAIQFHPEAAPGPHDAGYVFANFIETVRSGKPLTGEALLTAGPPHR